MRDLTVGQPGSLCHCGALRLPSQSQCRKCHFRCRWYRRKAWRINPSRQPTQNSSERSDTA
jgi:hypothetical protein